MLVFLDESGDPGFKFEHGSSKFFVVGLVTFDDLDEAAACEQAIADVRHRLSLSPRFEFHYAHNSDRQKEAFLQAVAPFGFSTHVFALDKRKVVGPGFQFKESLYKWTARTTFENARPYLDNAKIIIDGSGNRLFRKELSTYLRKRVNGDGGRHIREIKIQPSHQNDLLQLADYVAGIEAGCLTFQAKAARLHRSYLATHIVSRRIWPR